MVAAWLRSRNIGEGLILSRLVITHVTELEAVRTRSFPTVIIKGQLANDLLISGFIRMSDPDLSIAEVGGAAVPLTSGFHNVMSILSNLSESHIFQIIRDGSSRYIKIFPKPTPRREGN
jgi:hypothetical protein